MHCASAGGGGPLVVGRLSSSDQRLLPARDSPFQPLIQVLSYRILSFLSLFFFWQNPPICKFPCHSQNSLKDLHFVIFMLVQPWVWATENYFSFIIPQFWCFNLIFLWCNLQLDKCEEYSIFKHSTCCWTSVRNIIALLGFQLQIQLPAKVFFATLDKSFFWLILIELSVLFKVEIFFCESISTIQI